MNELERLLAACSTWGDGRQGLDGQAAGVLADWLEENGRGHEAALVRRVASFDPWAGVDVARLEREGDHRHGDDDNPRGWWLGGYWSFQALFGDMTTLAYGLEMGLIFDENDMPDVPQYLRVGAIVFGPGPFGPELPQAWEVHGPPIDAHEGVRSPFLAVLRAAEPYLPALKLAVIRHICSYTADRLIAAMAQDAKG